MHGQRNKFPLRKKKSSTTSSSPDVKLPKMARIEMPEDFKIRTQPLFSLPEEVLKLPPLQKKSKKQTPTAPKRKSSGIYVYLPI